MKYTFHIVDVFSSTPFSGNQLAVPPEAAGISTEGMQKIAREFNFGETTFVLPRKDPANTCRVGIFTPRTELDFAGDPSVGTACALVMKQHVRLSDPIRPILAGWPIAFRSSKASRWGAEAKSKRRRASATAW